MEGNKEKKITMDIEPFKPVPRTMYMCDNKFHTEVSHFGIKGNILFT